MTAGTEEKPVDDLLAILPDGGTIRVGAVEARVNRLKGREFLGLMRVLTKGLGGGLPQLDLKGEGDEVQAQLVGMFLVAVPNAIAEFIEFLMTIVEPVHESERARLAVEMQNPDPDVLLDILGVVAIQEKDDLSTLVGKARAWIGKIQTAYAPPTAG